MWVEILKKTKNIFCVHSCVAMYFVLIDNWFYVFYLNAFDKRYKLVIIQRALNTFVFHFFCEKLEFSRMDCLNETTGGLTIASPFILIRVYFAFRDLYGFFLNCLENKIISGIRNNKF